MKEKVYIEEAGCNRRMLDLMSIRSYIESNGHELVDRPENADIILVTTCAFKKLEEDESVKRLRHLKKYSRKMVVYGCLPDIATERYKEFADIPYVAPREIEKIEQFFPDSTIRYSAVAGSSIIEYKRKNIFKRFAQAVRIRPTMNREFWHRSIVAIQKKCVNIFSPPVTPYYLFICRGCAGKCSYCAIRRSIGSVHSKPIEVIVAEFQRGIRDGYREFIILGDDPGCYGIDQRRSLPELFRELVAAAKNVMPEKGLSLVQREIAFHLNEIHPKFLIPYVNDFLAIENFFYVRSVLCPIQSGSDRILELMQREHTAVQLEAVIKNIHKQLPQILINTEIIIGFPSETEDEFQETLDFVARCRFNWVVIFPYDDKDETASSFLPEKIPAKIIKKRVRKAFKYFAKAGITAYYKCP